MERRQKSPDAHVVCPLARVGSQNEVGQEHFGLSVRFWPVADGRRMAASRPVAAGGNRPLSERLVNA